MTRYITTGHEDDMNEAGKASASGYSELTLCLGESRAFPE